MLRLCLSVAALIAEEANVIEALVISWRRTARQELALLGAVTAAMVPTLISLACMMAFASGRVEAMTFALSSIDLAISILSLVAWRATRAA